MVNQNEPNQNVVVEDDFEPDDLYVPEESNYSFSPENSVIPDELIQEEPTEKKVTIEEDNPIAKLEDHRGNIYPLEEGKNIIGRRDTHVVIDDKTVSRKHCVIEVSKLDDGIYQYHIYDIGFEVGVSSTNGVFVSGRTQRLQDYERLPLSVGSTFKVGETSLKIKA
ncbi:MAG: FHA domain-containing protein [Bacteroidota bacterium]